MPSFFLTLDFEFWHRIRDWSWTRAGSWEILPAINLKLGFLVSVECSESDPKVLGCRTQVHIMGLSKSKKLTQAHWVNKLGLSFWSDPIINQNELHLPTRPISLPPSLSLSPISMIDAEMAKRRRQLKETTIIVLTNVTKRQNFVNTTLNDKRQRLVPID